MDPAKTQTYVSLRDETLCLGRGPYAEYARYSTIFPETKRVVSILTEVIGNCSLDLLIPLKVIKLEADKT